MRVDRNHPRQHYAGFTDWLQQHPLWLINVVIGFAVYLATTEEV